MGKSRLFHFNQLDNTYGVMGSLPCLDELPTGVSLVRDLSKYLCWLVPYYISYISSSGVMV